MMLFNRWATGGASRLPPTGKEWPWIRTYIRCSALRCAYNHFSREFKVAYDTYQDNEMTQSQHIQAACATQSELSSFDLWIIVGEWTPATTDCAKYLNGRGVGSRYDGSYPGSTRVGSCTGLTGSASTFSSSYKTYLRKMWEAQTMSYEKGDGWIQWLWKAEAADDWSYQAGLANGWIPTNPTDYKFPGICGWGTSVTLVLLYHVSLKSQLESRFW